MKNSYSDPSNYFRQQQNFQVDRYLSVELQVLQSKHTQHTGTHPHIHTHTHSDTHEIEPETLNSCVDQSLVVAIVKAMSISGIVKQLSIVSKVFLYLFFLRKGIDNQLNCLFGVHTHLVCNVPPWKWTLELRVDLVFCSVTKVFMFYWPHGYVG